MVRHSGDAGSRRWGWGQCLAAIYAIALTGTIVVVLVAQGGGMARVPRRWLGAFAGYVWQGPSVTSLSGSWIVPRIERDSRPGRAGTWIGAQTPGDSSAPFIQIGTNEERHAADRQAAVPRSNFYYAFWSDTLHHFHPQFLFLVRPGDRISASLSLARGRWRLAIVDPASHEVTSFLTTDEAHGAFNEAQWLQEDITDTVTPRNSLYPYPQLSRVLFTRLTVNHAPPRPGNLNSEWMSPERRGYIAPTPVRDDGYSLRHATLGAAAAQYLGIVTPIDSAASRLDSELDTWSPEALRFSRASPTQAVINAACARARRALHRGVAALAAAQWTPSVRRLIARLIRLEDERLHDLQPQMTPQPLTIPAWRYEWLEPANALSSAGRAIRDALHAPQFTPY
ncbi:MAG: G1 family glutamic endopeptidase [Solirubrobacteraceae bacterium]